MVNKKDNWYGDTEVTHEERVINGQLVHVISICEAEEREEFRG